jgi:hypothetical protein
MPEKVGWWAVGSAVGGVMFTACFYGFFFLHGLILADRSEAAQNLAKAVASRTEQMNRISDSIDAYQRQNSADHKEIMMMLYATLDDRQVKTTTVTKTAR